MKKLILTISILLCTILAKAQVQEKSYDDIVYLGLPSYLYKPSNNEITDFIKNSPGLTIPLPFKNLIFYTSGETLIRIVAFKGMVKSTYLEGQKEFFDYMNAQGTGTTSYSSVIKNINNARVLIVHEERPTSYCSFYIYATNTNNSKRATIGIDYKLSDKAEAQKIAESILANLRFEEAPLRPRGPARAN
jgi:hypothetical protein